MIPNPLKRSRKFYGSEVFVSENAGGNTGNGLPIQGVGDNDVFNCKVQTSNTIQRGSAN
jgi:hypothetical protein